ncbi:MAG: META domain-containing protein [Caldilineaceae bacterium]
MIGTAWQWTTLIYQPTGATTTIAEPQDYTLLLNADGTLSGKADCNSFSGAFTQESGLVISISITTAADCGDSSLDQQYLQLLGSIVAGGPDGAGGLALETAGGEQRLLFAAGDPATQ